MICTLLYGQGRGRGETGKSNGTDLSFAVMNGGGGHLYIFETHQNSDMKQYLKWKLVKIVCLHSKCVSLLLFLSYLNSKSHHGFLDVKWLHVRIIFFFLISLIMFLMANKIFATLYTKIFRYSFIWNAHWCCKGQLQDSLTSRLNYFRNRKL